MVEAERRSAAALLMAGVFLILLGLASVLTAAVSASFKTQAGAVVHVPSWGMPSPELRQNVGHWPNMTGVERGHRQ